MQICTAGFVHTKQGNGDNPGYINSMKFMRPIHSLKFNTSKKFLVFGFAFILFCVGVFAPPLARAATYYVANAGSDSNSGTSSSTSWQTVGHVDAQTFHPGDSILFNCGDAWNNVELGPNQDGAAGNPITFGQYGNCTGNNDPLITGLASVTGWSAYTSSTQSWTSIGSGFNLNDSVYTYVISSGGTTVASGSVTQANMKLSTVAGDAFVDFSAAGKLTPYIGDLLTITDHTGNTIIGNIEAVGTGETYGSEFLSNTAFDTLTGVFGINGSTISSVAGGQSGNALQVLGAGGWYQAYQNINLTAGMLVRNSAYIEKGTDPSWLQLELTNPSFAESFSTGITAPSSWTQVVLYATADSTGAWHQIYSGQTAGDTSLFDTASAKQVLTPSNTGVTIQSSPSLAVQQASLTTQPNLVFFNGTLGTSVGSPSAVAAPNEWYWGSNLLYVYGTSSPSGITASQANFPIDVTNDYIRVTGLAVQAGNLYTVRAYNVTGFDADNLIVTYSGHDGILVDGVEVSPQIYNNKVSYANGNGIAGAIAGTTNGLFYGNEVSHVCQTMGDRSGISIIGSSTYNNRIYNNYIHDNNATADPGCRGIILDTIETAGVNYVYDNYVWDNNGANIQAFLSENQQVFDNVVGATDASHGRADIETYENSATTDSNLFYGNTVYNSSSSACFRANNSNGNTFKNNICSVSGGGQKGLFTQGVTADTWDNNLVYASNAAPLYSWNGTTYASAAALYSATGQGQYDINQNPLFVSTSTNNFALSSSSPAIDTGLNLGSPYEYGLDLASTWPSNIILDNQNSFGSGWNIGAYVYTQTSTPSIAWLSPSASSTVSSTITLSASSTAVSPASIASVQFYLDDSPLGSAVTSSPYTISWNTAIASNSSHTLYALATDNYGNTATSSNISLTVYNAPSVSYEGGGGGGEPQSYFVVTPAATSTASSSVTTSTTTSTLSTSTTSTALSTSSVTTSSSTAGMTIPQMQSLLASLESELQALEAQAGASSPSISSSYVFTTDLQLHDTGPAVNALQSYLIQKDQGPAAEVLKIHGSTNYFGILTYNALVELQASVDIHATGYFGPITRAYVNGHE
jgi:hypothetical protein